MPWVEVGRSAEDWAEFLDWILAQGVWDDTAFWVDDGADWNISELWSEQ